MRSLSILSRLIGGAALMCCPLFSWAQIKEASLATKALPTDTITSLVTSLPPTGDSLHCDKPVLNLTEHPCQIGQPGQSRLPRLYSFKPWQQYAPVLLIGLGVWGTIDNVWFKKRQEELNNVLNGYPNWKRRRVDDLLQYIPMGVYQGLAFIPQVKHRHNFRDRLLLHATANLIMASVVNLAKHTISERRPDRSTYNSFPSGHTATAFVGAELVRLEYGDYYGLGAYAIATTVGGMRMFNKRHWLNDILAGAGVGILSARAAYWLLPWQKRLLGWGNKKKQTANVALIPSYNFAEQTPQMSISLTF